MSLFVKKKPAMGPPKEVKVTFHVGGVVFGKDQLISIEVDGAPVATLKPGEKYEFTLLTGNHTFRFNKQFHRYAVTEDVACLIKPRRDLDVTFLDPGSIFLKNV